MLTPEHIRQLRPSNQDAAVWYVVLEGAHPQFDILRLLYEFESNPEWLPIFQSVHYEPVQKAGPVLFIPENPENWLQHWQEQYPELPGSMLLSSVPIAKVCRHLESLASVRLENQREALFRFYDSWIMSALYPVLNNAERQNLDGPGLRWLWCTGGALTLSDESEVVPIKTRVPDAPPWLTLDEKKVGAIRQGIVSKRNWELGSNE